MNRVVSAMLPVLLSATGRAVALSIDLLISYAKQDQDSTRRTAILRGVVCGDIAASWARFESPSADARSLELHLAPTPV